MNRESKRFTTRYTALINIRGGSSILPTLPIQKNAKALIAAPSMRTAIPVPVEKARIVVGCAERIINKIHGASVAITEALLIHPFFARI